MSCKRYFIKPFSILGFVFFLIVVLSFQNELAAQFGLKKAGESMNSDKIKSANTTKIEIDTAKLILTDKLNYDVNQKGILKKILQPIKFKENRINNEKERIYRFMLNLIEKEQLKIDPATVTEIIKQLELIVSDNNSTNMLLKGSIKSNESANRANNDKIEALLSDFNILDKTNKKIIDSIKIQMSAFIQANEIETSLKKREITAIIDSLIKPVSEVKYSAKSNLSVKESKKEKDKLVYFKRSLKPKLKIIGGHQAEMKNAYLKYNYNYLSAINLDHFELSANGKCNNPDEIEEFQKQGGVIAVAQSKGCDVHLTIFNTNENEIRDFLSSSKAQDRFFIELENLIVQNKLKGVNINFDCTMRPEAFYSFIYDLKQILRKIDFQIELNISIPPVINNENERKLASYNFSKLNSLVNYYLVLTDNLLPQDNFYAQALSPLYKSDKFSNRTIESTFDYFRNTEIPFSKLIMTFSYEGMLCEVDDFSGKLLTPEQKIISYSYIQENYLGQQYVDQVIAAGFDPDQACPFINILDPDFGLYEQIWYEDAQSLFLKYNWALKNEIGGVSIKSLGSENNNPDLWNVLGASLMYPDTTYMHDSVKIGNLSRFWTIATNAFHGFSRKTFIQDLKWAGVVRLKYDSQDTISGYRRFDNKNLAVGSKDDTIQEYILKKRIWTDTLTCKIDTTRNSEAYQKNKSYCYSLYTRWTIYADFFFWTGVTIAVIALLLIILSTYLERYLFGTERLRNIIRNAPSILIFFTIILMCLWLYFDPSITGIGAGSRDGTNSLIMIYILVFGIIFGWFFTNNYYKYRS